MKKIRIKWQKFKQIIIQSEGSQGIRASWDVEGNCNEFPYQYN